MELHYKNLKTSKNNLGLEVFFLKKEDLEISQNSQENIHSEVDLQAQGNFTKSEHLLYGTPMDNLPCMNNVMVVPLKLTLILGTTFSTANSLYKVDEFNPFQNLVKYLG